MRIMKSLVAAVALLAASHSPSHAMSQYEDAAATIISAREYVLLHCTDTLNVDEDLYNKLLRRFHYGPDDKSSADVEARVTVNEGMFPYFDHILMCQHLHDVWQNKQTGEVLFPSQR